MLSISPLADPPASGAESEADADIKPYDLTASSDEIPSAPEASAPEKTEFVMGPTQMASVAFVAILVIGVMSAIAYFAGRKNTAPQSPVTERIIERIVPAPSSAPIPAAATTGAKVAEPTPAVSPVSGGNRADPKTRAEVTAPQLNQFYLQLGSLEVGVAQLIVEGLRQRGMQSIVGIGVNNKVARILVGPFKTPAEQQAAQKQIEEMGFHPFPRVFTARDLEQQIVPAAPPTAVAPPQAPVAKP